LTLRNNCEENVLRQQKKS